MYLLYSLLLIFWGILLAPALLYRRWRYGKRLPGLAQRLGRLPGSLQFAGRPCIWFHACSVGETLSLQPLVDMLHRRFPEARLICSTVTETGQLVAARSFAPYGEGNTFYFPFDLAFAVRRVLDWIRPAVIVIVETEIWPNLVNQAHRRGIPVVLANGRISAGSYRHYRRARFVLAQVFRKYRLLMMQSENDARRIEGIGAPPDRVIVTGNIKFDRSLVARDMNDDVVRDLESTISCPVEAPLIVAGSTHSGEEEILIEAFRRIRLIPELGRTRLLLAPRHPERFDEAARQISETGLSVRRRTTATGRGGDYDVFILDTVGELAAAYRFATVAFVGGTLVRRGGHSIMEPAFYSKPIVVGPSMENFRGIVEEFLTQDAIRQISASEEERALQVEQLSGILAHLLKNSDERDSLGRSAYSVLEKNRGATALTAERIAAVLGPGKSGRPTATARRPDYLESAKPVK